MKKTTLLQLASALLFQRALASNTEDCGIHVDVAIIGGGSGGINAAIQLLDANASVVVIEEKPQIGGHAETYYNPTTNRPTNIGVVIFEDTDAVKSYFSRLNVPYTTVNPLSVSGGGNLRYDFSLGFPIPPVNASTQAAQQQALAAAIQAYSVNVLAKYPWVGQGYLVPDPVPEELTMPFGEFAIQNNFTALVPVIAQFNWYGGDMSAIPTLYGIMMWSSSLQNSLLNGFVAPASGDTRSIYMAAAKVLGEERILLNSTLVKVVRDVKGPTGGVKLVVSQPGLPPTKINARKLLIATPPKIALTNHFDISGDEEKLLSRFSNFGVYAGVAHIPGLLQMLNGSQGLQNVGIKTPFNQPAIPGTNGLFATGPSDDFIFDYASDSPDLTEEQAIALLRADLTRLAAAGAVPTTAPNDVTIPYSSNHSPYYSRVSAADIQAGFYRELLKLQGKRNTYWTGAAWAVHNSAAVWRWNDGTVIPGLKNDLGLA